MASWSPAEPLAWPALPSPCLIRMVPSEESMICGPPCAGGCSAMAPPFNRPWRCAACIMANLCCCCCWVIKKFTSCCCCGKSCANCCCCAWGGSEKKEERKACCWAARAGFTIGAAPACAGTPCGMSICERLPPCEGGRKLGLAPLAPAVAEIPVLEAKARGEAAVTRSAAYLGHCWQSWGCGTVRPAAGPAAAPGAAPF